MVGEIEAELERSRAELDSVPKAVARMAPSVAPKKPTKLPTPKTNTRDETNDDKNEEACSSFFFLRKTPVAEICYHKKIDIVNVLVPIGT